MLVAQHPSGERVEAARDLAAAAYTCPLCAGAVTLKPGRVKVAHFAHTPGAICDWARESLRHHVAKRVLADRFRALGYIAELEESHPEVNRRVDVAVTMPTGHRVAVEVQDSAISVGEMRRRNRADRRSGFFGTVWVFTSSRAARLLTAREDHEVRVPDEIRWVQNSTG
jgi:competence CoiA-like predicted nuclease